MKLDKTSKKILFLMDCDARVSFTQLAKELRTPEATVRYRVKMLFEDGTIQRAYPVFGAGCVGMSVHKIMFKLQKADEKEIDKITKYLVDSSLVNWVARFDGHFDLGCTLLVKHVGQVSKFLDNLRQRFHTNIKELSYAVNIQAEFYPRDYLVRDTRRANNGASYYSYADRDVLELDRTDWSIVQAVADNARVSATDIASELYIAPETVTRRLIRLEKLGVITGYRLALDHQLLKRTSYYLLLYLNFVSEERLAKMLAYLRSQASVVYIIKMLGEWDYDISIELEDAAAYRAFMVDLMRQFSDVVRDVQTLTTWHVAKYSILPASTRVM